MFLIAPVPYPATMRRRRARNSVEGIGVAEIPIEVQEASDRAVPVVARLLPQPGRPDLAIEYRAWEGRLVTAYRGRTLDRWDVDGVNLSHRVPPQGSAAVEASLRDAAQGPRGSGGDPISSPFGLCLPRLRDMPQGDEGDAEWPEISSAWRDMALAATRRDAARSVVIDGMLHVPSDGPIWSMTNGERDGLPILTAMPLHARSEAGGFLDQTLVRPQDRPAIEEWASSAGMPVFDSPRGRLDVLEPSLLPDEQQAPLAGHAAGILRGLADRFVQRFDGDRLSRASRPDVMLWLAAREAVSAWREAAPWMPLHATDPSDWVRGPIDAGRVAETDAWFREEAEAALHHALDPPRAAPANSLVRDSTPVRLALEGYPAAWDAIIDRPAPRRAP